MMNRRRLWAFPALLFLTACGNMNTGLPDIPNVVTAMTDGEAAAPSRIDADVLRAALTPAALAQTDERLMLLEIPARDAAAILSLVGTNQGVVTYLTADGVSLSLQNGLLVATRGFGFDLMTADVKETLAGLRNGTSSAVRIHRYLDGENQIVIESFVCSLTLETEETARETCKSSANSFTNSYTLNESGVIVRSTQWVSPQNGSLEIEILN